MLRWIFNLKCFLIEFGIPNLPIQSISRGFCSSCYLLALYSCNFFQMSYSIPLLSISAGASICITIIMFSIICLIPNLNRCKKLIKINIIIVLYYLGHMKPGALLMSQFFHDFHQVYLLTRSVPCKWFSCFVLEM